MKSTTTQYALLRLMCTHKNPILFKTFDNVKHEKLSLGTGDFVLFTVKVKEQEVLPNVLHSTVINYDQEEKFFCSFLCILLIKSLQTIALSW